MYKEEEEEEKLNVLITDRRTKRRIKIVSRMYTSINENKRTNAMENK